MNEEQIKKMIADDFDNLINEKLDSAIIFKYISNIEKENQQLKENNQATQEEMARTWAKLQQKEDIINKAKEYVINHLKQDMLSDFTGANYIQEYIEEPDGLLEILNTDKGDD